MCTLIRSCVGPIMLLVAGSAALAAELRDIELRRLMEPTPAERRAEESGGIYIYEGLRTTDIDRVMREQFDRVDSMMFIRVQPPAPAPGQEGETQTEWVRDDGC